MTMPNSLQLGTFGGTFLCILPNLHSEDVVRTVVLAGIGALVSFFVSVLLKWLLKNRKE